MALWMLVGLLGGCRREPEPRLVTVPSTLASATPHTLIKPPAASGTATHETLLPESLALRGAAGSPGRRLPLIVFLHGLGASGELARTALRLDALAQKLGFAYVAPTGPKDSHGRSYFNAGLRCCDLDAARPNHVAELSALLERLKTNPTLDATRFYLAGFSNGGFMADRMICDRAELIAATVNIAGMGPGSDELCSPARAVPRLKVHGDADQSVPFTGGHLLGQASLPNLDSVESDQARWARRNQCSGVSRPQGAARDLVASLPGAETQSSGYSGCRQPVELWTIQGGKHMTGNSTGLLEAAIGWVLAH